MTLNLPSLAKVEHCALGGRDEHGITGVGRRVGAGSGFAQVEDLALTVAPDELKQLRDVDERVAVVLVMLHGLVAVNLLVAHGIVACPAAQQFDRPVVEGLPGAVVEHVGVFPVIVLVGTCHVEIGAGKVSLVAVVA